MESLKVLRSNFHAQFLNVRQCKYLLDHDDFEIAWLASNEEEQAILLKAIENKDGRLLKNTIKKFMEDKTNSMTPYEKLSLRKLQRIGNFLGIKYYKKKTKKELIEEIKDVTERLKKSSERVFIQSEQTDTVSENTLRRR